MWARSVNPYSCGPGNLTLQHNYDLISHTLNFLPLALQKKKILVLRKRNRNLDGLHLPATELDKHSNDVAVLLA